MAWLFFAFSGPVLWAISTHFDKYLVERYFKHNDVAVLLVFTALMGLLTLPFIAYYERTVFEPSAASIALIVLSGILYMGADAVLPARLAIRRGVGGGAVFPDSAAIRLCACVLCPR